VPGAAPVPCARDLGRARGRCGWLRLLAGLVRDRRLEQGTPADLPPDTTWVYDPPLSILLNLAVGGNWPGSPDDTTVFPQQMLVDYVRVYSRKPESHPLSSAATKPGAPYIDSDVWASSEGRPLFTPVTHTQSQSKPTQ